MIVIASFAVPFETKANTIFHLPNVCVSVCPVLWAPLGTQMAITSLRALHVDGSNCLIDCPLLA